MSPPWFGDAEQNVNKPRCIKNTVLYLKQVSMIRKTIKNSFAKKKKYKLNYFRCVIRLYGFIGTILLFRATVYN